MSSNILTPKVSIADYYPRDTTLFYGYPSGEASGFYNTVPPWVEELVSARPLATIRPTDQMQTVVFERPAQTATRRFLRDTLGYNLVDDNQVITLPKEIDGNLVDLERNKTVERALIARIPAGKLNMAQPFRGPKVDSLYQIDPQLTTFLNDKANLPQWVDQKYLPRRYAQFPNGAAFTAFEGEFASSCVVKVSSSSAGDGVVICKKNAWGGNSLLGKAREKFRNIKAPIFVEEYVESDEEGGYGVQFAIPFDKEKPIQVLGFGRQLITQAGEFLGSFIDVNAKLAANIQATLVSEVLPKVRQMGWFGMGGLDIIVRKNGDLCIIDPNFRLTAVSAPLIQALNSGRDQKVIPFTAYIDTARTCFRTILKEYASEGTSRQMFRLAALAEGEQRQNFNAALLYRNREELKDMARALVQLKVRSLALDILAI